MITIYAIEWYVLIQIISVITFILTFKAFKNLPDHGYTASKGLGILLSGFISWIIMSCNPGKFEFTNIVSYISVLILLLIAILQLIKTYTPDDRSDLYHFFDKRYRFIIFIEASFLLMLTAGAYIRGFSPDILAIHKLQELTYIKSILQSSSLPPENLWFSGYKLNYYYTGYFILANLMNIAPMALETSYNLLPGTILAIIALITGGFIYNLTSSKTYGIIGGIFAGFIGNYHALKQIITSGLGNGFDWWLSAHLISNGSYTEFPYWSFLLGDIQPYFFSHIVILLLIYVIYAACKSNSLDITGNFNLNTVFFNLLIIILLSISITSNIYTIPLNLLLIVSAYILNHKINNNNKINAQNSIINLLITVLATLIISMPFISNYTTPIESLEIKYNASFLNFSEFFSIFGMFFIFIAYYCLTYIKKILKLDTASTILATMGVISLLLTTLVIYQKVNPQILSILFILMLSLSTLTASFFVIKRNDNPQFRNISIIIIVLSMLLTMLHSATNDLTLIILIVTGIINIHILLTKDHSRDIEALTLLFISILLLFISKFAGYKDDITLSSNLIMQTLILMPIITVLLIYSLSNRYQKLSKEVFIVISTIIILPAFVFCPAGTPYKSSMFNFQNGLLPNLSGINHMMVFHNEDYMAIEWLKENVPAGTAVLEGINPKSELNGRISGYAGTATLINAPEEVLFTYGKNIKTIVDKRLNDLTQIYENPDKYKARKLLNKYNIRYIYVGELEKQVYPTESLKHFAEIAEPVYNTKETTIYRLHRNTPN